MTDRPIKRNPALVPKGAPADQEPHAIVRRSDLSNRWDAGFHIARAVNEDRTAELRETVSEEEAVRRLRTLRGPAREALHPLVRTGSRIGNPTGSQIDAAIKEYPHLALAMAERGVDGSIEQMEREIAQRQETLHALRNIGTPDIGPAVEEKAPDTVLPADTATTFTREGVAYPLRDPDLYDDENGEGYGHVMVPPGDGDADGWLRDMWVVNERGEVHPGYDANPIPVRISEIDTTAGVEVDVDLPERTSIMTGPGGFGR